MKNHFSFCGGLLLILLLQLKLWNDSGFVEGKSENRGFGRSIVSNSGRNLLIDDSDALISKESLRRSTQSTPTATCRRPLSKNGRITSVRVVSSTKQEDQGLSESVSTVISRRYNETPTTSTSNLPLQQSFRGGATGILDANLRQSLLGVVVLALIEKGMKEFLKACKIQFPAMLAGCLGLFGFLVLVGPRAAQPIAEFLAPGAAILAKWLPIFFVPGLALLPLAPSVGGALEVFKVLGVVVLGLLYTIITVGTTVSTLQNGSTGGSSNNRAKKMRFPKSSPIKKVRVLPFSEKQVQAFEILAVLTGILTLLMSSGSGSSNWAKPCETSFLTFFTIASYMWAARLPASFVAVVHPLVTTCVLIWIMVQVLSVVDNGRSFQSILRGYKVGSLTWSKAGSGDLLLYLLGPSAVSFAISMYGKRGLLQKNLLVVVSAVLVSSVGGLYGTAAFVRLIHLGGAALTSRTVRLSVLSRNVTTALALALTSMIGGDLALAATVVALTGVLGATYGKLILEYFNIQDPIARGLCIGCSAQGLGVASMADEADAFPFAAMAMVLTALTSTTLVTFPVVKESLIKLATGQ